MTHDNPQEYILVLEKALAREKKTNKLMQTQIESFQESQYDQQKELLSSFETARVRQIQLQFLDFVSQEKLDNKSTNEMIFYFLDNISQLFDRTNLLITNINNKGTPISVFNRNEETKEWSTLKFNNSLIEEISSIIKPISHDWYRVEKSNQHIELSKYCNNSVLLCLRVSFGKSGDKLAIISIPHYCYSDDFKKTLQLAAEQFSTNIAKRNAELERSYSYKKLQSTVSILKATQKKLAHNEKMVALGQLAAGVAHEVNNPLSYIFSNLQTLSEYIELYEQQFSKMEKSGELESNQDLAFARQDVSELIQSCLEGFERISSIVKSLNTFSKSPNDQQTVIDINDVIESALKVIKNQIKDNHLISKSLSPDNRNILGSSGQLQQVFVNLFINALHALSNGGELKIKTEFNNDFVNVIVSDNGKGMDQKSLKKLFDPFYTTKTNGKGTGLGLSVSYAILTKHNAQISVKSAVNKGSTFSITFPTC